MPPVAAAEMFDPALAVNDAPERLMAPAAPEVQVAADWMAVIKPVAPTESAPEALTVMSPA